MTQGNWNSFSLSKDFTVDRPKAGFWPGDYAGFYVKPDRVNIYHFTVLVYIPACNGNTYKIDNHVAVPIVNRSFTFSGVYSVSGTFNSSTHASGQAQINNYFIQGCGTVSTNIIYWSATWSDDSQPINMKLPPGPALMPADTGAAPAWLIEPEAMQP